MLGNTGQQYLLRIRTYSVLISIYQEFFHGPAKRYKWVHLSAEVEISTCTKYYYKMLLGLLYNPIIKPIITLCTDKVLHTESLKCFIDHKFSQHPYEIKNNHSLQLTVKQKTSLAEWLAQGHWSKSEVHLFWRLKQGWSSMREWGRRPFTSGTMSSSSFFLYALPATLLSLPQGANGHPLTILKVPAFPGVSAFY